MISKLEQYLKQLIKINGYITLDNFLSIVIKYYYSKKESIGADKDFITAPEISQMFGEIIGVYLGNYWLNNLKGKFTLVELGPGKGLLMNDILRATKNIPKMHDNIEEIALIEISPILKQQQERTLKSYDNIKINWYEDLNSIDGNSYLIIANEFFDALPIKQYHIEQNKKYEVVVSFNNDNFILKLVPVEMRKEDIGFKGILEISTNRLNYATKIAKKLQASSGAAIIIDYGYIDPIDKSTIQVLKNHKKQNSIFDDLGNADITSLVNFKKLVDIFDKHHLDFKITSQAEFLLQHGINKRAEILIGSGAKKESIELQLKRLLSNNGMGLNFKVLTVNT